MAFVDIEGQITDEHAALLASLVGIGLGVWAVLGDDLGSGFGLGNWFLLHGIYNPFGG